MSLVFRLIVGRIEIIAATSQTGIHDGQVLIRQGKVYHQLRLIVGEEGFQLLHVVSIHLSSLDVHLIAGLVDILHDLVALSLATAGYHKVCKHLRILSYLECGNGSDASGANHQYFTHFICFEYCFMVCY